MEEGYLVGILGISYLFGAFPFKILIMVYIFPPKT
jgi:hypothetical protein